MNKALLFLVLMSGVITLNADSYGSYPGGEGYGGRNLYGAPRPNFAYPRSRQSSDYRASRLYSDYPRSQLSPDYGVSRPYYAYPRSRQSAGYVGYPSSRMPTGYPGYSSSRISTGYGMSPVYEGQRAFGGDARRLRYPVSQSYRGDPATIPYGGYPAYGRGSNPTAFYNGI